MKSFIYAILVTFTVAFLPSCKKDVKPTLIVTAYDTTGKPLENVNIVTHPCYFNQDNCDTANLNPAFHKEQLSNSAGQATFEFPYSAVLDVVGFSAIVDTSTGDTVDVFFGRTVVAIETKELKKNENNEFTARVTIDERYQP